MVSGCCSYSVSGLLLAIPSSDAGELGGHGAQLQPLHSASPARSKGPSSTSSVPFPAGQQQRRDSSAVTLKLCGIQAQRQNGGDRPGRPTLLFSFPPPEGPEAHLPSIAWRTLLSSCPGRPPTNMEEGEATLKVETSAAPNPPS
jgi:hypothetical protein